MTSPAHHVYLLRHGTTEWSLTGQHTSHTDVALTAEGELRARQAGQTLTSLRPAGPLLALASPLRRAQRTAALAGFADVVTEPLLTEWDYGEYEGLTTEHIRKTVPGWTVWTHSCPGGESADDVTARADKVLARVRRADSDVVLIGHGHFSRVLIARWIGLPSTAGVHFALDAAGVTVLGDERGESQIQRSNIPPWQHG